jgi:hypothetical protein
MKTTVFWDNAPLSFVETDELYFHRQFGEHIALGKAGE